MLKGGMEPLETACLLVLYRLDIPITPKVASANFYVDKDRIERSFCRLHKRGYLFRHPNGAYELTDLGVEKMENCDL